MVISGTNLLNTITAAGKQTASLAPQLMKSASGHLDRMMRSSPNKSDVVHSLSRQSLAASFQAQVSDPIGALIANSSRAWMGIGARSAS